MSKTCKNCDNAVDENFCDHCGQSIGTGRINMHFLWDEIQSQVLSFDKGILYTSKQLFLRPGESIREYLAGKRVTHIKPIALVILLTGVFALLYGVLGINTLNSDAWKGLEEGFNEGPKSELSIDIKAINDFKNNHIDLIELTLLPLYSMASFIVFRKYKYNFAEHLVLNGFITTQKLVVNILMLPLFSIYNSNAEVFDWLGVTEIFIGMLITVRIYTSFFNRGSIFISVLKSGLVYLSLFTEYVLLFFIYLIVLVVIGIFRGH
ncbi:MAG: DUF3667 domain-containing protein [Mucilaginibacter sp.]